MNIYEKAAKRHFFEVEYGEIPGDHQLHRLFAEDELDAINRMYNIFGESIIIYEAYQIGK